VPRHVTRLVTLLVAPFIVDYSASRRLVVDYSVSRKLVARLIARRQLLCLAQTRR
jgi:hypothetical protein